MSDDTKKPDDDSDGDKRDPSVANDDATILRPKDKQDAASDEPNDDATQIRGSQATPNNDETVVRVDSTDGDGNAPDQNETIVRNSAGQGNDGGTNKSFRGSGDRDDRESTVLRSPDAPANDSATILRGPASSDNATILREPGGQVSNETLVRSRQPRDSDGEHDSRRQADSSDGDDSTVLRGDDNQDSSTRILSRGGGDDATVMRDDGDDDRTVINDDFSDDSTAMGPGIGGEDTTYIASVGRQIKPQGNSEAGRLLKNRFVLEEKIGSGGMGDVYKALDLRQQEAQERDPYIAIKLLNENFSRHKDAFLSLQRETSRTRGIPHPNIMGVYDFDREGDTVFMSMELLDGKPLDDYLKEHPEGVSHEDAWNIIDGICKGLQRAHDAGIIHSDFKPGNIFYTSDKTAKVFDFGIARAVSSPGDIEVDGENTVFDAGSLGALTPTYASYEMLKGLEPSKSDDVYAVALVAYELFMGKHPYDRVPADKALERGIKPKPVPFLKRRHWQALKKALELKGEDRTQSIDEFYEGMFSEDPPYARYAAVAFVLVASIGFGAYQAMNVREKPSDLVELQDTIAGAKTTLRVMNPNNERAATERRWESDVWHEQLQTAMQRFRLADSKIQENPEWIEEWEDVTAPDPELAQFNNWILDAYLDRIKTHREDALTYSNAMVDKEQVQSALELLEQADFLMQYVPTYRQADPERVAQEAERLSRQLGNRTERLASIVAEEKRIAAEQEAARIAAAEAERERIFRENRRNTYNGYLAEIREILECKGNVLDEELEQFGTLLTQMENEWQEAFEAHYPTIVSYMATCIQQRIGYVDPKRAREVKARVVGFLPNETAISSLVIEDKDPCAERRLVGRGSSGRSWCEDPLSEGGKGPELVVIPPINSVTDFKYAISRSEIKIGDYNLFCEKTGCAQIPGSASLPATNISIEQARNYTRWLSAQTGQKYRLPTEREWKHAAVATNADKAVDENINCTVDARGVRLGDTLLNAISGRANDWGLYNVVGNAREWAVGEDNKIVALGGAHTDPRQDCTLDKWVVHQGSADAVTGFRVVREIADKKLQANASDVAASE